MTNPLDYINNDVKAKSIQIFNLLESMPFAPTTAQKLELSNALNDCSILDLNVYHLDFSTTNGHVAIGAMQIPRVIATRKLSGIKHLAEALKNNKTITSLNLGHCDSFAASEQFILLCQTLEQNKTIQYINLTNCELSSESGLRLAEVLAKNDTLTHLDITHNNLNSEAAASLIRDTKLVNLDLSQNYGIIESDSQTPLTSLSDALRTNTALKTLSLKNLRMTPKDTEHLVDTFKINHTLTTLDLSFIRIYVKSAPHLKQILTTSETLERVILSNTTIDQSTVKLLTNAISSRKEEPFRSLDFIEAKNCREGKPPFSIINRGDEVHNQFQKALKKHGKHVKKRAYLAGAALHNSPLNRDLANIVAGYLGYKGEALDEFAAGMQNKPSSSQNRYNTKYEKYIGISKICFYCAFAGLGLILLSIPTGLLPLLLVGVLVSTSSLATLAWLAYKDYQSRHKEAAISKLVSPAIVPTATVTPPSTNPGITPTSPQSSNLDQDEKQTSQKKFNH